MHKLSPIVHVVDDDPEIRKSLAMLLDSVAIDSKTYGSASEFLASCREYAGRPAVLVLDVRMPETSGMALLELLRKTHPSLPIIMVTGHGDIDMAVRAMKLGAVDFITKPFKPQQLLDRIQDVLAHSPRGGNDSAVTPDAAARLAALTVREREIMERIVAGMANKAIARDLGISVRTVESHRANLMEKLKAKTVVDLVLLAVSLKDGHGMIG